MQSRSLYLGFWKNLKNLRFWTTVGIVRNMAKKSKKISDQTEKELLKEIYADIDALMNKILTRLDSQSNIIVAMTKRRVAKMFIDQIAQGGNKVFLYNELKKIDKKRFTN